MKGINIVKAVITGLIPIVSFFGVGYAAILVFAEKKTYTSKTKIWVIGALVEIIGIMTLTGVGIYSIFAILAFWAISSCGYYIYFSDEKALYELDKEE